MYSFFIKNFKYSLVVFFAFVLFPHISSAAVLLPGSISTCGELAAPGTYTLIQDINGGSSTCFTIGSDNITIDGGGYTLTGPGDVAFDARARLSYPSGSLTEGADAYTNLVITDITVTGYTTGINISGNADTSGTGQKNGMGGDAGDVAIFYSRVGSIIAHGGDSSTQDFGGVGGNIAFTDTDLDISDSTISLLGGTGTDGSNTHGGLDVNHSSSLDTSNLILSQLSFLEENTTNYGIYPGGTWPITNTLISTCGTLYASTPTTFTLTQNITDIDGTCFYIAGNDITIDGDGYSLTAAPLNTSFAITASYGDFDNLTINNLDIVDFANSIDSTQTVSLYSDTTLDLSNETINADILDIKSVGVFSYVSTTLSDLSLLTINNTEYGDFTAGLLEGLETDVWTARDSVRPWSSIAMSADGTKLVAVDFGGQIYTSTDSGVTWTPRDSNRNWVAPASSADGTKLAANVNNGQIYTSTDSGVTWTAQNSGSRAWRGIASSADGTKLVATVNNGQIYTSTDSGVTWTARESSRAWRAVASSADGTKLAAVSNGQIYTSTDSGVTWTARDSSRTWISIASSADGTKLVANVDTSGQIYTSTDSGVTWAPVPSVSPMNVNRDWISIASSADGNTLAGVVDGGFLYTSTDSGMTWTTRDLVRNWTEVALSADGNKLAALGSGFNIYTKTFLPPNLSVSVITPADSSSISTFNPRVSWGSAVECEYSYDNFTTTSIADCSLGGSDIEAPSIGVSTLSIRGYGNGQTDTATSTFTYIDQIIDITAPVSNATYQNDTWNPNIDYDNTDTKTLTLCEYSYDNFATTSIANCSFGGADILPPTTIASHTLYLRVTDDDSNIYTKNVTFSYRYTWVDREVNRNWNVIVSSANGTKLAAAETSGLIYTSTDSGVTWTAQASGSRAWQSMASSSDGTKLVAVATGEQIYVSTDSGVTWSAKTVARNWKAVTSSSDGLKLVAAVDAGRVYRSVDGGDNWIEVTTSPMNTNRAWRALASSADGTKLVAGVFGGFTYTSTDSGVNWTQRASSQSWGSLASSADGTKLVGVVTGGNVWTSTNSGSTWTSRDSSRQWRAVASSSDGTKLAAAVGGGSNLIYLSTDSGLNWTPQETARAWNSIASTSDGTKVYAVATNNKIYTYNLNIDDLSISIISPVSTTAPLVGTWEPQVNWSIATNCYYSYDNFATTTAVDCSLDGSDIPAPPSDGSYTLYVKGIAPNGTIAIVGASIVYTVNPSEWVPRELNRSWNAITSSADGTMLAATVSSGRIYTSTDSGVTWVPRELSRLWNSIRSSADGTKLIASLSSGFLYTSTDSGATWTPRDSSRSWRMVTSSADGTKLGAVTTGGYIYISTNSGVTWTQRGSLRNWSVITSSADGNKLAAAYSSGNIETSTNGGLTWTQVPAVAPMNVIRSWNGLASSADGTKLVATVNNGQIYTSANSGATWTARESNRAWRSVTSSADGTRLAATVSSGQIYISTDSGVNWTPEESNRSWSTITSSADGTKLAAVVSNSGQIYTKSTSNPGLTVNILTPVTGSTISEFTHIVSWGTSVLCEYSYDNTNWTTVDCDALGSDIIHPSATGLITLYIRGADASSNQDTDSSTFMLTGYYFCGTIDGTWNTSGNWFVEDSCTIPASVPASVDNIVYVVGTTSPIIDSSVSIVPENIDTMGMTGPAASVGVIFADAVNYSGTVTGNATFNGSSYNSGLIIGDATFNTDYYSGTFQTGATLNVVSNSSWQGEVQGNVYNGDSTPIANWTFIGTGSNAGIINGDATFTGTTFTMGDVQGTATLTGFAQIIQGINNVVNFFKDLTSGRDTVYLTSGSSLHVSGLATLLGTDINNLLTVRSTTPNLFASFESDGTTNFNFLRLKDINNTGSNIDLSAGTVFDDGGNTGFTFPSDTSPETRVGITGSYTEPVLPPSRGGNAFERDSSRRSRRSNEYFENLIKSKLDAFQFSPFNILGQKLNTNKTNTTSIQKPSYNFESPEQSDFLFSPKPIVNTINSKPQTIEAFEPQKQEEPKKENIFIRIWKWFINLI